MNKYKIIEENVHEICKAMDRLFQGEPTADCVVAMQMEMAQALWLMKKETNRDEALETIMEGIRGYYQQICDREARR